MTTGAPGLTIKQVHATLGRIAKGLFVACKEPVERAVVVSPLGRHEGAKGIANLDDGDLFRPLDVIKGGDEHVTILGHNPHPFRDDRPGIVDPVIDRARDLVLFRVTRHFKPRRQRKQGLGRKNGLQPVWQPFLGGRIEPVAVQIRRLKPPVMEQHPDIAGAKVPQGGRIARNALANTIHRACRNPFGADPLAALTNPKAQTIAAGQIVMMAGPARDIAIARQDLVIEQKLADLGLRRVDGQKVVVRQRSRQISGQSRQRDTKGEDMKQTVHQVILAILLLVATPAFADIEAARDLMEDGKFSEAREALLPFARSGNADAEELIGVMYALGLGVEKDPERAFEWYLRASMKGHPGAQSGIGWYYELGLGMPAPDLVRAYLWYALSSIGGDPDAVDSLEQLQTRMSPDDIARAQVLVNDYKPWMYPFR